METIIMKIYGVCISDISHYKNEEAEKYLESLLSTECKDIADDYYENKEEGRDLNDWLYGYESCDGYYGLSALLADVIRELEGIDISCDDPHGVHYLGLSASAPWSLNEKTRNISKEEYENILRTYISKFTDDELEIT